MPRWLSSLLGSDSDDFEEKHRAKEAERRRTRTSNESQNQQASDAARSQGLDKDQREALQRRLENEGGAADYGEIERIAKEIREKN